MTNAIVRVATPADVRHAAALFAMARCALMAEGMDATLEEVESCCELAREMVRDENECRNSCGPQFAEVLRDVIEKNGLDDGDSWKKGKAE